jgi:hypothetical protein
MIVISDENELKIKTKFLYNEKNYAIPVTGYFSCGSFQL